ncbi:hypothetical protein NEOLEDRAFT_1177774 [Neolentinus lepideus HHB14362 ss-1]|uniref:Mitotic checkpoint regulator, MAD2B-interacting-domain-containing protein n=1 Tax=Neolentinus lepideus HHB14362 ss-1 TaxID=1314782 RepID=A0A165TA54_9AGAM|nr:hypothetical protein NEOLEDRAFT_1177774 [Neolentinus lepideus HHB14362 ss-1]
MLGVEDYGSDNDSEQEVTRQSRRSTSTAVSKSQSSQPSKTNLSHPPSGNATAPKAAGAGLSLPPPKSKPGQKKKKITIDLPSLEDEGDNEDDKPAAKKPRLESGAGKSSLLSMLPAPKRKAPLPPPKERVLGGGQGLGLMFKTHGPVVESTEDDTYGVEDEGDWSSSKPPISSVSFLPPSLQKGKANISTEGPPKTTAKVILKAAPAADFFSLGMTMFFGALSHYSLFRIGSSLGPSLADTASPVPSDSGSSSSSALPILPTGVSSAPKVDDFIPPEPTPTDPYPGYYQTSTGQWAAYDVDYYKKFYDKWKADYDKHVRALEKGQVKGFEGFEEDQAEEVDAQAEMERAKKDIQEREERKKLTHGAEGAPVAPKMNIKGAALGGRARSRHQLSTLLTEAYTNRETLEEKLAQGRRNRKEAGMKYVCMDGQ